MKQNQINKLIAILLTILSSTFLMIGCKDNATQNVAAPVEELYDEEKATADQHAKFEQLRKELRQFVANRAKEDPEETSQLAISLMDYEPITYLLEFEKKYPKLKIVKFQMHIKGMSSWSGTLDPSKSLKESIDAMIEENKKDELESIETHKRSGFPASDISIKILEAIKEGNVRTYAFEARGKTKDLEAMTTIEFNKTIRVVEKEALIGKQWVGGFHEPIYASLPKNKPDRDK